MSRTKLKCNKCGTIIETIPQHCGQGMVYNEEKNDFECWMGPDCGFLSLRELLCEGCAVDCHL